MKTLKKCLAMVLAFITLFSICSASTTVLAAEYTEQKARTEYFDSALSGYLKNIVDTEDAVRISEKEQVDEVVEEENSSVARTANTFSLRATPAPSTETAKEATEDLDIDHTRLTLELEDGENVAYLFSEPVSFIDDEGNLVYKDTNIKAVTNTAILNRGYSYENGDNDYKAYFSEDSSRGLLLVEKDGEEIKLVPNGTQSVGTIEQIESDMELVDSFEYAGVYGTDTVLRFLPQLNGCKEEIVLSSYQGISDFSFTLYTEEGTIAAINSNGEVEIIDSSTKDIITTFVAPFANDSSGGMDVTSEHYTDCTYELELISEGEYTLTISVPKEYLESESTVYPVIIDPTTNNVSMTYDAGVYSGTPNTTTGSNPSACFGKSSTSGYGKGRALFKFNIPSDIKDYAKISSAKIWLREVTGRTETLYVRPYLISSSWNNSVTWNTKPSYKTTCNYPLKTDLSMPRRNINSVDVADDAPYWYDFNILYAVKSWTTNCAGNHGLIFISENESSSADYQWRGFATKEHTTSSYRPYVVIGYTNDTKAPTIQKVEKSTIAWTNESVTVTILKAADDNEYGLPAAPYSFDGGATWQSSNEKIITERTPSATWKVRDRAGNTTSGVYTVGNIDKKAPNISDVDNPKDGVWSASDVTVTVTAKDDLSGIDGNKGYSFNSGTDWQSSNSKTYSTSGTYPITVKVQDRAKNISNGESGGTVKIDKTAPTIKTPTKSPSSEWSNTNVTVTNNVYEYHSGIAAYSFDGGSTWQTGNIKTYSGEGTHTVKLSAKDNVGNIGHGTTYVKIDKTSPTATVTGTISGDYVTLTVNATDSLSGLPASPYSYNGGTTWITADTLTLSANETHTIMIRDKADNRTTVTYNPQVGTVTATPSLDTWTKEPITLTANGINIQQYNFDDGLWGIGNIKSYDENTTAKVGFKASSGNITYINVPITNIDTSAPVINSVTAPEGDWSNELITVTVDAEDDLSGIAQYSFNGGSTWQTENSVTFTSDVPESVSIKVKDNAGNEAEWDEIINLPKNDNGIPAAPDIYEEDGLVYISSRSFNFNENTESPEHIEYKLGDGEWTDYDGEPLTVVRTGEATISARVVDGVGNESTENSFTLENTLGQYTASYTDIALGEGLFPIEFGRTYTSTKGWFFTFDANVQSFTNGYVFTDFYGEKQYYIKNKDGKYLSHDEEELTIVESTDEETGDKIKTYSLNYGDMIVELGNNRKLSKITTDYTTTEYKWNTDGSLDITGGATVSFTDRKPTEITITRTDSEGKEQKKVVKYEWSDDGNLTKFFDAEYSPDDTESDSIHNYAYTNGLLTTSDTETIDYSNGRVKKITQPNGAFVKYTYNDNAANSETPNNIGAVTVSDSKGVTDTIPYSEGVVITSSLDSYSDKAVYAPNEISNALTTDAVSTIVYVVEEQETGNNQNGEGTGAGESTPGDEPESDGENATDNDIGEETNGVEPDTDGDALTDNEAGDTDDGTENGTESGEDNNASSETETPLYEEIDENTYAFYAYDEQGRATTELTVLKSKIADITKATFESAQAVAESKVTYDYLSDTDDSIKEQISYIKTENGLVSDVKECYTYNEFGDVLSHLKYGFVGDDEILLYSESYEYNDYGNVATHTETQYATEADAFDVTYTTSYTYDVWGMCTGTTVTCGEDVDTTVTEYDLNGVTLSVTYNDEKVVYTYTDFGTVDKETVVKIDGETQTVKQETDYTYDTVGNLISCLNPDGDTSYYEYDDYGNLTNHNFNGYFFTYNTLGSILTASVNDTVLVEYDYKGAEQKLSYIDYKNGQTINYAYDEATGDLLTVSQGETTKFSYSYSDDGEITTLTDNINNIIKVIENDKVTVKANADTILYSVENLYEDEETPGSFNGKKITVGSDIYALKSEENKDSFYVGGTETEAFIKTYENDYAGNLWKVNTANAVLTEYGYDDDKNVSTLKNTINGLKLIYKYEYDDEGNILSDKLRAGSGTEEELLNSEPTQEVAYTYDEDNQLLSAETADTKWAYNYDVRGNITSKTEYSVTIGENNDKVYTEVDSKVYKYEDNVWADKLTEYDEVSIEYDIVGNPVEYLGDKLTWTMGRQLAEYRITNGTVETEDDTVYSYNYNEDGIRTSKTVNNVTTTYYLDGTNIIEQITGNTVLHFYYDSNDEIIGFTYNEADYFYVKNAMSDIIGIVDDSGILITSYVYDAWGKVLSVTGSNVELGNLNPFRYRSYYYDSDIEMYYLQSRYYDPEICRFINSDDVNFIGATGTIGSYNAFAYCENEPVNRVDKTGYNWKEIYYKIGFALAENYLNSFLNKYLLKGKKIRSIGKLKREKNYLYSVKVKYTDKKNKNHSFNIRFGGRDSWYISSVWNKNFNQAVISAYCESIYEEGSKVNERGEEINGGMIAFLTTIVLTNWLKAGITSSSNKKRFNAVWGSKGIDANNKKGYFLFEISKQKSLNGLYIYSLNLNKGRKIRL